MDDNAGPPGCESRARSRQATAAGSRPARPRGRQAAALTGGATVSKRSRVRYADGEMS